MNNQQQQNAQNDADEAAARRLQAEIWLAEQLDHHHDNIEDRVRRLLGGEVDANGAPLAGGAGRLNNDDNDDDDEAMDNDEDDDDDEEDDDDDPAEDEEDDDDDDHREAIDGGVAGEVYDDQRQKITRSLKCPLVRTFSATLIQFGCLVNFRWLFFILYTHFLLLPSLGTLF